MMKEKTAQNSALIKSTALKYGFQSCGISAARFLEEDARPLEHWLEQQFHGEMSYMENHFDKRLDPRLLVEGAKSVISLTYNYFPEEQLPTLNRFKISKYAYGEDYHFVIKDIMKDVVADLREKIGDFECRIFTDSAPVLERSWARNSGLGWIGKNANLLSKGNGSFFFLAEIICDLDLETDAPVADHCGTCRKCIEACPTDAIVSEKIIDGSKCISYATIELKDEIPSHFAGKMQDWIFGCDICQDVCPWNRFSAPTRQEKFKPNTALHEFSKNDWYELTQEIFSEIFRKSPVKRTKFAGLQRNINFIRENLPEKSK